MILRALMIQALAVPFLLSNNVFANMQSVNDKVVATIQLMELDNDRFGIQYCEHLNETTCTNVGEESGYSYDQILSLNGGWQRFVGAPLILAVDGVIVGAAVGGIIMYGVSTIGVGPALSMTSLGMSLGAVGGGSTGAAIAAPITHYLIPDDSALRAISASYHWRIGRLKRQVKKGAKSLTKSDTNSSLILFESKYGDSKKDKDLFDRRLSELQIMLGEDYWQ